MTLETLETADLRVADLQKGDILIGAHGFLAEVLFVVVNGTHFGLRDWCGEIVELESTAAPLNTLNPDTFGTACGAPLVVIRRVQ